ncbi:MAG TPA: iron uptake transporter deferrochelatase/peroxidase subunit [Solirubrobacteraceae bacterium]
MLAGAVGLGVGAGIDHVVAKGAGSPAPAPASASVPFYGAHQAGIATPAQDYMSFAAFDLTTSSPAELQALLRTWTAAIAELAAGRPYEPRELTAGEPPQDPGEALGLGPAALTVTVGFGPGVFASGRYGLIAKAPPELRDLPPFPGDQLDPARSGGDIALQACADDPQVAFHAVHVLAGLAAGTARLRWTQLGFGRTSSTTQGQTTPRNLMGFKDGTDNIRAEDTAAMDGYVWAQPQDGVQWMTGGTYLIARRIRIRFDVWDATSLEAQEQVIGRRKLTGAPLGGAREYDPVNLAARGPSGQVLIPNNAHIRIASPENNGGQRLLRRGYSYSEGNDPATGKLDAGLFFIAFQRSPTRQFIPVQDRLAAFDALNRHTVHTTSAIFACPPGPRAGGYIGEGLFA